MNLMDECVQVCFFACIIFKGKERKGKEEEYQLFNVITIQSQLIYIYYYICIVLYNI